MTNTITAIILTHNESVHVVRCIDSLSGVVDRIVVVDSGSIDGTTELARTKGADVYRNPWINYATQFNWALDQTEINTDWVFRIDADEIVSEGLLKHLIEFRGGTVSNDLCGIYVRRRIIFQGREIKWGGCGNLFMLRMFRFGRGRCESRWMDEHIVINFGATIRWFSTLYDDNRSGLTYWIGKHNQYATREAIDVILRREAESQSALSYGSSQIALKRYLKDGVYARSPKYLRACMYFSLRFFFQLGFLDGLKGLQFHFMQCLWYRFLVDMKIEEFEDRARRLGISPPKMLSEECGVK